MSGSSLTIAVVGAGIVGGNLARRFADLGHRVLLGARDPGSASVQALATERTDVEVVELAVAGREADVVVLAVPAAAVDEAMAAVLSGVPDGRPLVVVDATNDVAGTGRSPYERVAEVVGGRDGVAVVKAFNTIGAEAILHPVIDGRPAFLPIAGPAEAAEVVRGIATAIGFDARVIGGAAEVHHLEAHARLWIHLAFRCGLGRAFGFAIVDRSGA